MVASWRGIRLTVSRAAIRTWRTGPQLRNMSLNRVASVLKRDLQRIGQWIARPWKHKWVTLIPELKRVDDLELRDRIGLRALNDRGVQLGTFLSAGCLAVLVVILNGELSRRGVVEGTLVRIIVFAALILLGLFLVQWAFRNRIRATARRLLGRKGILYCIACGYDLRGQQKPMCPECGSCMSAEQANVLLDGDLEQQGEELRRQQYD
jgi:hypothetical protein